MSEFFAPILTEVADLLQTLVITALGALGLWAVNIRKRKFKSETTNSAIEEMHKFVTIVVGDQNQRLVEEMKKQSPNGKLTEAQQDELLNNAIETVMALMSEESINILTESSIVVEDLIRSSIESKINKNNQNKTNLIPLDEVTPDEVVISDEETEIIDCKDLSI